MLTPLRIGILGAGWAAEHHALGYRGAGVEIVAVSTRDRERRRRFAERFEIAQSYADPAELLERNDIDAVSVCVPNALHAPLTLLALDAGKHVLCEKPPSSTAAEAKAMASLAHEKNRVLTFALQRRHNPATEELRNRLANQCLGSIYQAKAVWARTSGIPGGVDGWFVDRARASGGALLDIGIHVLDLAWFLLGRPKPKTVSGRAHNRHGAVSGSDESAFAFIRFEGDVSLNLEVSWLLPQGSDRMGVHLYGTRGGAEIDDDRLHLYPIAADPITPALDGYPDAFVAQAKQFAASIRGAEQRTPAADGVVLMQIIEAIYRSSAESREVLL